jgi:hypothetical protein
LHQARENNIIKRRVFMKRFNLVVVCLVVLGLVASASLSYAAPKSKAAAKVVNANVEGKWYFTVVTPTVTGNPVFTFKQDGGKLTGTYAGTLGEAPLTGTVKGNDITFQFSTDPKVPGFVVYTGKVDGNKMSGTIDFAGRAKGTFEGDKIVKK